MVFLRQDVNSPKNAEKKIIYAILREKNESQYISCFFLHFQSKHGNERLFFYENNEISRKPFKNSHFRCKGTFS